MHRRSRAIVAAFVLAVAGVLCFSACGVASINTPAQRGTSTATANHAMAPTTPSSTDAVVYWVGSDQGHPALYQDDLFPDASVTDPVTSALWMLMTARPSDERMHTSWQRPAKLATSISGPGSITVDISPDAFAEKLDAPAAHLALQQLVYTATTAADHAGLLDSSSDAAVTLLVNGQTDYQAFGSVKLSGPIARDPQAAAAVWLTAPYSGSRFTQNNVTVAGRVKDTSAAVTYQLSKLGKGGVSSPAGSGPVSIDAAHEGKFSFTVPLDPGQYSIQIRATTAGETPCTDSRDFSVLGVNPD